MMQLSPLLKELIESKKRVLWLFWFAFLLCWVLYTIVAYLGTHTNSQRPSHLSTSILYVFIGIAIVAGVCSLVIPRIICSETKLRKMLKEIPTIERLATSRNRKVDYKLLEKLKSLTLDEQRIYAIFAGYGGWYVVIGAIVDLVAVISLIPAILGVDFVLYFYFGIPALVLKVLHYPKLNALLESLELIVQKGTVA
jgi:hypothetical protein